MSSTDAEPVADAAGATDGGDATGPDAGQQTTAAAGRAAPPQVRLDRYDQSWYSRGRAGWVVVLWDLVQACLIGCSPHPCYAWRRFCYRCFGARIGRGVRIRKSVRCNYPWRVRIDDHAWIGDEAWLYALDHIHIGDHAVVSQRAYICTGAHDPASPSFALQTAPVHIERNAWVALGASVLMGVRVGEGAVVGAGAVLHRDAAPWTIYGGVPAKAIGERRVRQEPDA